MEQAAEGHAALRFNGFEAIPVRIVVRVGETRCRLNQLGRLKPGDLIHLDRRVGEPFELRAGAVLLGPVEPVVVKDGVAVKLVAIPEDDGGL